MSNAQVARKRYTQQQFETPFNVDAVDFQHDSKETILEHCRFVSQSTKVALPGNIFDQVHAAAKNFIKRLAREFDFSSLTTKQALEIAELFRYEKVVLSAIIKSSADIPLNATQLVAICKNQCNNTLGGRPIYHFYEGQWPVWKTAIRAIPPKTSFAGEEDEFIKWLDQIANLKVIARLITEDMVTERQKVDICLHLATLTRKAGWFPYPESFKFEEDFWRVVAPKISFRLMTASEIRVVAIALKTLRDDWPKVCDTALLRIPLANLSADDLIEIFVEGEARNFDCEKFLSRIKKLGNLSISQLIELGKFAAKGEARLLFRQAIRLADASRFSAKDLLELCLVCQPDKDVVGHKTSAEFWLKAIKTGKFSGRQMVNLSQAILNTGYWYMAPIWTAMYKTKRLTDRQIETIGRHTEIWQKKCANTKTR